MSECLKVASGSIQAKGGRKSSTARVFLWPGTGQMVINKIPADQFFSTSGPIWERKATEPLEILGVSEHFNLYITVKGGGITGQAGAIRLAIANALDKYEESGKPKPASAIASEQEEDSDWHTLLKRKSCLTRDPREVERKKAGLRKARKRPQFSKR
tara:strand:+ start:1097 stop:1567 length:471 start_codon:yes stop_codon:yes gene_type:complete